MAISRGLEGAFATSYDDEDAPYTPAWQERHTGIGRETAIRFAREFATNAELTNGKSMVIVGASANHWYYNNLCYRSATVALILCGCCGVNGGGINHYVGQEKLAPVAPWNTIAMALDWTKPPRVVQSSTWHYAHSCQWRYEQEFTEYGLTAPNPNGPRVMRWTLRRSRCVRAGCRLPRTSTAIRSKSRLKPNALVRRPLRTS